MCFGCFRTALIEELNVKFLEGTLKKKFGAKRQARIDYLSERDFFIEIFPSTLFFCT